MIRVLVVEDSPTIRELLVWMLDSDPGISVVGTARDGSEALAQTLALKPDVITMDVHLPVMNGFEVTREIMAMQPTPIIIVSSSVDVAEVTVAMTALEAGALAVLRKPFAPGTPAFDDDRAQLLKTVKAMTGMKLIRRRRTETGTKHGMQSAVRTPAPAVAADFRIVAIAASTGGPAALAAILKTLPAQFPLPIVVVQHISAGFMAGLAAWLDSLVALQVKVAVDGELLKPGTVYLAAEDRHLGIDREQRIRLDAGVPVGGFRPSADHLFEAVSRVYGTASLAIILTGMGSDGVKGLRYIAAARGTVIAQDEATSVVFGMPRSAVEAGLANHVLSLHDIGRELLALAMPLPVANTKANSLTQKGKQ